MRRAQLMGLALAGVLALGAGVPVAVLAAQGFTGGNATNISAYRTCGCGDAIGNGGGCGCGCN